MNRIRIPAIKVSQPLGDFFLLSLKASTVLSVSFSEELQYVDENGKLKGSQRKIDDKRLKEIGQYIDSVEMAFPNSVILAVNYTPEGNIIDTEENDKWIIESIDNELYYISFPLNKKLAVIIDGQHRINAFNYTKNPERSGDIDIPCSIFFELPNSYQAFLFATVNGNQKKVDRSLALEQFGFNVEEEPRKSWTPEKLAVYFSRKLNIKESPFQKHIKVAPKDDNFLVSSEEKQDWYISTSAIVDGIVSLISQNPKRDRVEMQQENLFTTRSRKQLEKFKDNSPFRMKYLNSTEEEDDSIYETIVSFFKLVEEHLWSKRKEGSYIVKTIGIQALFDFLKFILAKKRLNEIGSILLKLELVDFSNNYFQASGIGRGRIKNLMLYSIGELDLDKFSKEDIVLLENILLNRVYHE